ncbi:MAG: glycosyltransferase family 39 protein [Candidatus Hydrogenedentes bacterium]|nr:glycosyltransferase family 39 protein [Candidatus Hydrogenedentota bacterium]
MRRFENKLVPACLLLITLLAAALRLWHLGKASIWFDEGGTFYFMGLVPTPWRLFDVKWVGMDAPLFPALAWFWYHAGLWLTGIEHGSDAATILARLLPCILSTACVPMAYVTARELTRTTDAGLIAAFLVAISPFQIYYAQELRAYALHVLLALGALWCMARALDTNRLAYWAGLTLLLTASIYNHFYSVWVVTAFNAGYVLTLRTHWRQLPRWTVSQLCVVILAIPAIRNGLIVNEMCLQTARSWYPPLTFSAGLITFKDLFAGYTPNPVAYYGLAVLAALLTLAGAVAMRRRINSVLLLAAISTVPIALNLVIWHSRAFSFYEHRLFIFSGVTFTILAAAAISHLPGWWGKGLVLAAMTGLTLACLADHYAGRLHPSPEHRLGVRYKADFAAAARHIRENLAPGDVIAHYSHVTLLPSRHFFFPQADQCVTGFTSADREGIFQSFANRPIWEHMGVTWDRLENVAARAQRVWFAASWWEPFDMPPDVRLYTEWLDLHGVRLERKSYSGLTLYLYDLASARNVSTKVARVADFGGYSAPSYITQSVPQATDATANSSPVRSNPAIDLTEFAVPGFSVIAPADGMVPASGLAEVAVRRAPSADSGSPVTCEVYLSADVVMPLAFERETPDADLWSPVVHGNPSFRDSVDPVAMAAHLDRDTIQSPRLRAQANLPPGTYSVVAHVWKESAERNSSRAQLRFMWKSEADGGRERVIGEILPWASSGTSQWSWIKVGAVQCAGPCALYVTAHNVHRLADAYGDLGRVVFLSANATDGASGYRPVARLALPVNSAEPYSKYRIQLPSANGRQLRTDLVFISTDSRESRLISLYSADAR